MDSRKHRIYIAINILHIMSPKIVNSGNIQFSWREGWEPFNHDLPIDCW